MNFQNSKIYKQDFLQTTSHWLSYYSGLKGFPGAGLKREFHDGFFDVSEGDGGFNLHFFFLFAFAFYDGLFERQVAFFGGAEDTFLLGFIEQRNQQLAADIVAILPQKFQGPTNTRTTDFQHVFVAKPAVRVEKLFEVTAEFLAFFKTHTGIAVGKNVQFVAGPEFDIHGEAIIEGLIRGVFFFEELCYEGAYFHTVI